MKQLLTACLLAAAFCGAADAQILFDFRNEPALYDALDDQAGPVSYTNSGLVATFTASDGTMNRTSNNGLGVNSTIPDDDTEAFDAGEWIDIRFESAVTLSNITVSSWNAGIDQAVIYVDGASNGVINSRGSHNFNISVPTGQVLKISGTAGTIGNGWSLDSISVEPDEPLPNIAPVLADIGNKSIILSNSLSFTVSATDVNGDDIVLAAVGLPPGAVFNTVTNAGAVSNTFSWAAAAPTGTWQTVFTAADGTTNVSETITITVSELPENVTFDFRNDAALYAVLDEQSGPVDYNNNGLTATFTASEGKMNRTTDGFGINTSVPGEDADKFDPGEWIDITFDSPVTLTNVAVSDWSTNLNDQAAVYVNGSSNGVISASGNHPFSIIVPLGNVLRIQGTGGAVTNNGWSLDSISVRTSTNPPPAAIMPPALTLTHTAGYPTVTWDAVNEHRYTILWSPSLLETFRTQAVVEVSVKGSTNWIDTINATNDTAFYQLEVERID